MGERRKFIRITEQAAISYNILPGYKSQRKMMEDLSLGGVRFISEDFVPVHSLLKIEIKLKYIPRVISAIVRIVWIKSIFDDERYDVGAEFVNIDKEDLTLIHDYLDR